MVSPAEIERKLNAAEARIREMIREIDRRDELISELEQKIISFQKQLAYWENSIDE